MYKELIQAVSACGALFLVGCAILSMFMYAIATELTRMRKLYTKMEALKIDGKCRIIDMGE